MGFSFTVVTFVYFMFLFYCFGDSSPILRFFVAGPLISYFFVLGFVLHIFDRGFVLDLMDSSIVLVWIRPPYLILFGSIRKVLRRLFV